MTTNADPEHHDDNIHALRLAAIELEGPHAVVLLIPVRASSAVHATATDVRLAISADCGRGCVLAGRCARALRLVQLRCGDEVLDDGAVDCELVLRSGVGLGGRLSNQSLQDRVLFGKN